MTKSVISVEHAATLPEIAKTLERHRIKRVPVVKDNTLIGIITRSNLLQALAAADVSRPSAHDDRAIREQLLAELQKQPWVHMALKNVVVQDGVVSLWGMVSTDDERRALRIAAENIPGVKASKIILLQYQRIESNVELSQNGNMRFRHRIGNPITAASDIAELQLGICNSGEYHAFHASVMAGVARCAR
jgi:predicted transcriptional regulator